MREATLYLLVSFMWGSEGLAVLSAMGAIAGTVYTVFGNPYNVIPERGALVLTKFLATKKVENPMSVFVFNYCVARLPKNSKCNQFTSKQIERLCKEAQNEWYLPSANSRYLGA